MNPTLIITRGLPGSGKTTWALSQDHTRVNRDCLRDALHSVRDYTEQHEHEVTLAQNAAVRALLAADVTVIVDDTNLPLSTVRGWHILANQCGANLQIVDHFLNVPVDVCIRRQANRPHAERVPAAVIRRMWSTYLDGPHAIRAVTA